MISKQNNTDELKLKRVAWAAAVLYAHGDHREPLW